MQTGPPPAAFAAGTPAVAFSSVIAPSPKCKRDRQQLRSRQGSHRGWSQLLPERRARPERNPGARQTPRKHLRVALAPVSCGHGRISRKTQAPGRGRGLGRGSQQLPFLKDVEVKFASRVLSARSSRGFDHGDQSPWFSFPPPLVTIFT